MVTIITPGSLYNLPFFAGAVKEWTEKPSRLKEISIYTQHHLSIDPCDIGLQWPVLHMARDYGDAGHAT